jgi:uncharacterized tellurite resistance protein B-like protein
MVIAQKAGIGTKVMTFRNISNAMIAMTSAMMKMFCFGADSFGIGEESLEEVLKYLQDYGYENTEARSLGAFGQLPLSRRIALGRHMAEIAKADDKLSAQEIELLKRTVSLLHIDPRDLVRPD